MNRLVEIKELLEFLNSILTQKWPIGQVTQENQILIFYAINQDAYTSAMTRIDNFSKKYGYNFRVNVYPYWGNADVIEAKKIKIYGLYSSWCSNIKDVNFELFDDSIVSLMVDNHCSAAVFEAFKYIESTVREKGKYNKTEKGVPLMRKAFNKENGMLINSEWTDAEKEAVVQLFAGAIGFMKNPSSHHMIDIDKGRALEMLNFAHYLLRVLNDIPIKSE